MLVRALVVRDDEWVRRLVAWPAVLGRRDEVSGASGAAIVGRLPRPDGAPWPGYRRAEPGPDGWDGVPPPAGLPVGEDGWLAGAADSPQVSQYPSAEMMPRQPSRPQGPPAAPVAAPGTGPPRAAGAAVVGPASRRAASIGGGRCRGWGGRGAEGGSGWSGPGWSGRGQTAPGHGSWRGLRGGGDGSSSLHTAGVAVAVGGDRAVTAGLGARAHVRSLLASSSIVAAARDRSAGAVYSSTRARSATVVSSRSSARPTAEIFAW